VAVLAGLELLVVSLVLLGDEGVSHPAKRSRPLRAYSLAKRPPFSIAAVNAPLNFRQKFLPRACAPFAFL
jgi:hypothetical protein